MLKQNKDIKKKIVPRGKSIDWTDEEIDAMVSGEALDEIVKSAKADWEEKAPRGYKNLLDAKPE